MCTRWLKICSYALNLPITCLFTANSISNFIEVMKKFAIDKAAAGYWLKVFALYALMEVCIQLTFLFILNNFGTKRISIFEFHLVMWIFQCLLIWPIWGMAWLVRKENIALQITVNLVFYVVYSYFWFGPVQQAIGYIYQVLQESTRPINDRQTAYLDKGDDSSYLNYQLLKHAFRLSWYYLATYFYNYRIEENKRTALAIANKELQLKLLKWHLNPSFYFKTITHLRQLAADMPSTATLPLLQLARVMEYVIYEAKEKLIDVKKEIQFIGSYIQLINQQSNNKIALSLKVEGEHETLKIAPLLLAGFIDNITAAKNGNDALNCTIKLQFSDKLMQFSVHGIQCSFDSQNAIPLKELHNRIQELYPQKFEWNNQKKDQPFKLSLWLYDE